jgi:beta-lactamase superfamily II metal-dependent hydrolase
MQRTALRAASVAATLAGQTTDEQMPNSKARRQTLRLFAMCALVVTVPPNSVMHAQTAKTVDIYFIDTEGGQSTLIVTPSGQSVLVDAGYAGSDDRDAKRIAAAAKLAGAAKIDYLVITHHHVDHQGGVPALLERLSVGTFIDHGPSVELGGKYPEAYEKAFGSGRHQLAAPGDKISIPDLDLTIVASAAKFIRRAGEPNPYCAGLEAQVEREVWENPQSVGFVLEFGRFRFADFGDLSWNGELAFLCPSNPVGKLDLYLSAHHGTSVTPRAEWAMAPRVTVMNNGARKGGDPASWKTITSSPGLEDLWQLHFSVQGGKEHNVPDRFIANVSEECAGDYLRASASQDGSFTIFNSRTKQTKRYAAK